MMFWVFGLVSLWYCAKLFGAVILRRGLCIDVVLCCTKSTDLIMVVVTTTVMLSLIYSGWWFRGVGGGRYVGGG